MSPLYTCAGQIIDTFDGYVPACAYITGACAVGGALICLLAGELFRAGL